MNITIGSCKFMQHMILAVLSVHIYRSIVYYLVRHFFKIKGYPIYYKFKTHNCLSCIEAAHVITYMNELPIFSHYLWLSCLRQDTSYK